MERISARAIRQSFSALVWAIDCSDRACWEAIWDCRYCQIEVATSPATPMTKLERKLWYVWMNFPSFESFSSRLGLVRRLAALFVFSAHRRNIL